MEPNTLVDILVGLATLEEELLQTTARLAQGDKRERMLTELQTEYVADADEARSVTQERGASVRGGEAEIRQVEARLRDRRDRLAALSDRRQYQALKEEVSRLEQHLDQLETRTLEEMDRQADASDEAENMKLVSHWEGRKSDRELEQIQAERRQLKAAEAEIRQEIERVVHLLPVAEGRTVLRLRGKLDQAVVHHHDGACTGCFHQLPRQQALDVDHGRTVFRCPSCMRYIVHRPWGQDSRETGI